MFFLEFSKIETLKYLKTRAHGEGFSTFTHQTVAIRDSDSYCAPRESARFGEFGASRSGAIRDSTNSDGHLRPVPGAIARKGSNRRWPLPRVRSHLPAAVRAATYRRLLVVPTDRRPGSSVSESRLTGATPRPPTGSDRTRGGLRRRPPQSCHAGRVRAWLCVRGGAGASAGYLTLARLTAREPAPGTDSDVWRD